MQCPSTLDSVPSYETRIADGRQMLLDRPSELSETQAATCGKSDKLLVILRIILKAFKWKPKIRKNAANLYTGGGFWPKVAYQLVAFLVI